MSETGAPQPSYALALTEPERIRYRVMAERAAAREGERWTRYGAVEQARIADIGCGPGAILVQLGRRAGESGAVIGVEPDPRARAAAEEEISAAGLRNCRVKDGDGEHTGIGAETQDLVMVRHVLFHVGDRLDAVIAHASSLLRPGGHLYVVDTDLSATRTSVTDGDFADSQARYRDFQRRRGNNVDIGPRLGDLLADAGLELVEHEAWYEKVPGQLLGLGGPVLAAQQEMLAAGEIDEGVAQRWDAARQRVAAMPHAALFLAAYLAVGRRPG